MYKQCPICNQIFYKPSNYTSAHFQKKIYCSNKCRAATKRNGEYKFCKCCKTQFYNRPCEDRQYCSKSCFDTIRQGVTVVNSGQFRKGQNMGENHYNWKGGVKSETQKIRDSAEYKSWRRAVFQKDDFRCFDCGEKGGTLNADHIFPFAIFPRLRLDINNGRTLCIECHKKTSTYAGKLQQLTKFKYEYT